MKIHYKPICATIAVLSLASTGSWAQRKDVNYDESKVSAYTLPAILTTENGRRGLPSATPPAIHEPIMNDIGYHIRAGKHDVSQYDWLAFLDFADKHFKNPNSTP